MKRIINEHGAFDIRHAEEGDLDYILSSWQLTWERSPEWNMPGVIRDEYFRHAHLILDELISRSSANGALYVCHHTGSPHLIRGYLCGEVFKDPDIAYLHWVQVKKPEWNKGVGQALMQTLVENFRIDLEGGQNILYTFSNSALKRPSFAQRACREYNLVYWPTFKYTSQAPGWESGRAR